MQILARDTSSERVELAKIREKLNGYVRALHKPRYELGISLFKAQGELAQLLDEPVLNFTLPNLDQITNEEYHKDIFIIREIVSYDALIQSYHNHPWKGVTFQTISLQQKEEIASRFQSSIKTITDFQEKILAAAEKYALVSPQTLREGINLLRVLLVFNSAIFTEEYRSIVNRYDTDFKSGLRFLSINYWKESSALAKIHRQQKRINPKDAAPLFNIVREIRDISIKNGLRPISGPSLTEQGLQDRKYLYEQLIELIKFSKNLFDKNENPAILEKAYDEPVSSLGKLVLEPGQSN